MDFEKLLKQAIQAIRAVQLGQIFKLRDLFEGHEWEAMEKGDRLRFGSYFKRTVNCGKVDGVIYFGKAPNNSALYQKKMEESK